MMAAENTAIPEQRTVSLPYAGRVLGIGKSTAYELAARGEFPVRVLQLGRKKLGRVSLICGEARGRLVG